MPLALSAALIAAATVYADTDRSAAIGLLEELTEILDSSYAFTWDTHLPQMLRTAHAVCVAQLAERLTAWIEPLLPIQRCARTYGDALLAETRGAHEVAAEGFADAASRWHDFAAVYEEAQALLGQGRCLVALGRTSEAAAPLVAARDIFARLGAKPALAKTEGLIQQVASA